MIALLVFVSMAAASTAPLEEYGVRADSFTWVQNQKRKGAKTQHLIDAEGPGQSHVEIRILSPIDEETAKKNIENEANTLKNLYAAPQTPYMGDIAQAVGGCPSALGPKIMDVQILNHKVSAVLGAASSDRAFGACTKEAAKFRGAFFAFYDKNTQSQWTWRITAPWPAKEKLTGKWLTSITERFKK